MTVQNIKKDNKNVGLVKMIVKVNFIFYFIYLKQIIQIEKQNKLNLNVISKEIKETRTRETLSLNIDLKNNTYNIFLNNFIKLNILYFFFIYLFYFFNEICL